MAADGEPCLYAVLGLRPGASPADVRAAFRALARRFHPDKAPRHAANPQALDETPDGLSHHDMFSLVARAHEVLSDDTKRATYDLLKGHSSGKAYDDLRALRRGDAERAVALMKVSFDVKRRAELSRGGLVIDDAVYGPRALLEKSRLEDLAVSDLVVNVTRQLQCLVENSRLVIPAGEAKHHWVPGLYDPAIGVEKVLWVRYFFRGKLHRVQVTDQQRLLMPLKSHCAAARHNGAAPCSIPQKAHLAKASERGGSRPMLFGPVWPRTQSALSWVMLLTSAVGVACLFIDSDNSAGTKTFAARILSAATNRLSVRRRPALAA